MTSTSAWTISAWPPVAWHHGGDRHGLNFVHLGTHVATHGAEDFPRMGQTIWGGRANAGAAGISWDWIEVAEGIVAIADPMMLITNLQLLDGDGTVLTAHQSAPHLNAVIHRLPWQAEVRAALARAAHREGQPARGFANDRRVTAAAASATS